MVFVEAFDSAARTGNAPFGVVEDGLLAGGFDFRLELRGLGQKFAASFLDSLFLLAQESELGERFDSLFDILLPVHELGQVLLESGLQEEVGVFAHEGRAGELGRFECGEDQIAQVDIFLVGNVLEFPLARNGPVLADFLTFKEQLAPDRAGKLVLVRLLFQVGTDQ